VAETGGVGLLYIFLTPQTGKFGKNLWKNDVWYTLYIHFFGIIVGTVSPEPRQFGRSMTGHRSKRGIREFWQHCLGCDEWKNHPILQPGGPPMDRSLL